MTKIRKNGQNESISRWILRLMNGLRMVTVLGMSPEKSLKEMHGLVREIRHAVDEGRPFLHPS